MACHFGSCQYTVFPAYAGMNRSGELVLDTHGGVPRLRGDEPARLGLVTVEGMCSPPTRG